MLPSKKYTTEDFLAIARKSVALVAIPTAVGLFVSLLYSSRIPDVWEAETLIQVVPQRVPTAFIQSTVTIKTEDRLEALAQQVKSRTQLERMIVDLNLYPEDRATRPMQDVVETMRLAVVLDPVRTNRSGPVEAFYLRFRYSDPVVAARATERLGTLYVDQNARERGALAEGARDFLEAQLADANARLEAQDKKLAQFREQHAGRLPSQLDSNMQAIQNMQLQRQSTVQSLAQDRDRKMMLERLYNDLISSPLTISPSAQAGAPTAEAATLTMPPRQRLELERANLARLQQRLTTDHPDVKRSRRQVEELETLVATAPDAATPATPAGATPEEAQRRERISGLRAEIESLDRQIDFKDAEERRISRTIAEYQGRIEAVPGVESEWLALTRDYDTLRQRVQGPADEDRVRARRSRPRESQRRRTVPRARRAARAAAPGQSPAPVDHARGSRRGAHHRRRPRGPAATAGRKLQDGSRRRAGAEPAGDRGRAECRDAGDRARLRAPAADADGRSRRERVCLRVCVLGDAVVEVRRLIGAREER